MRRRLPHRTPRGAIERAAWLAALAERVREGAYVVDANRVALALVRAARHSLVEPAAPRASSDDELS